MTDLVHLGFQLRYVLTRLYKLLIVLVHVHFEVVRCLIGHHLDLLSVALQLLTVALDAKVLDELVWVEWVILQTAF